MDLASPVNVKPDYLHLGSRADVDLDFVVAN